MFGELNQKVNLILKKDKFICTKAFIKTIRKDSENVFKALVVNHLFFCFIHEKTGQNKKS